MFFELLYLFFPADREFVRDLKGSTPRFAPMSWTPDT
jgi:hypothetical protein